jgi:signal peptidase I
MAIIVIQFVIQAFKIPSSSMEDSLLVGDFLLGLKFVYGSPKPFSDEKLPGFTDPERGDILIFRYPGEPEYPDYDRERYSHVANLLLLGNFYWDSKPQDDEKSLIHYFQGPKDFIKRCIAKSGDLVELKKGHFFLNGKKQNLPGEGKYTDNELTRIRGVKNNFGPYKLPKLGETVHFNKISLEELHHFKSIILQENPKKIVTYELSLLKGEQKLTDYNFDSFQFKPNGDENYFIGQFMKNHQKSWIKNSGNSITPATIGYWQKALQHDFQMIGMSGNPLRYSLKFSQIAKDYKTGFLENTDIQIPPILKIFSSFSRPVDYSTAYPQELKILQNNIDLINLATKDSLLTLNSELSDSLYQSQKLSLKANIAIDGKAIENYTIKEDLYFVMGDNRDNSADSRYWGYLSKRNVKAKAFLIYFSFDHSGEDFQIKNPFTWWTIPFKTRWTRIGKLIHGL